MTSKVILLLEYPLSELHTGVAARVRHVQQWLHAKGVDQEVRVVNQSPRGALSALQRTRSARLVKTVGNHKVIVIGLGSPPMMHAARVLAKSGTPQVIFDACDSSWGQLFARARAGSGRLVLAALWMVFEQVLSRRFVNVSYITDRDRKRDGWLAGREYLVIPAIAPGELRALPSVRFPVKRIVVAGDLSSFHNRRGLLMLNDALESMVDMDLDVQLYGPVAPRSVPGGVRFMGYAQKIDEIYAGDTAVFITNVGGTGVPNKLIEAVAAGRPMILHESQLELVPTGFQYIAYRNSGTLAQALSSLEWTVK